MKLDDPAILNVLFHPRPEFLRAPRVSAVHSHRRGAEDAENGFDAIIPISEARALHAACPSASKRLVEVRGAGHNNLLSVGMYEYFTALKEFVDGLTT